MQEAGGTYTRPWKLEKRNRNMYVNSFISLQKAQAKGVGYNKVEACIGSIYHIIILWGVVITDRVRAHPVPIMISSNCGHVALSVINAGRQC